MLKAIKIRIYPNLEQSNFIDMDLNAAINIMKEGKRIIGLSSPELTLVDYPTVDDRLSNKELKSSDMLKQEKNVIIKKIIS